MMALVERAQTADNEAVSEEVRRVLEGPITAMATQYRHGHRHVPFTTYPWSYP